ncbi:hypothetical protein AB0G60_02900 [Streptomyces angustmyceticus]|uniref:Uncharacterized protein n=2 Tax=Streptomyces angustmyceticus TaxID=285578 RepID=A0A5J4LB46_9ACTN|nr:hypothetical protein [Streptomyces angustmyceticus]UAL65610.1 hypothetical protein K7396_02865 [Streptomyces angustmyceticus]GES27868.1 hypothetical protein San01_03550 [Streptomyces angustmyceticus]
MEFRLANMDVRWSGVDDTTPPGHCLATGMDPLGVRVWLFKGDRPSDDGFCGSLLIPSSGPAVGYGPTGAYVTSSGDHTAMLARLAKEQ